MPNWTANSVIITANNNAQQNKIKELHDRMFNGDETFLDGLFEYFVPSSKGDDWYQSNIDNWGCKWDAREVVLEESDETTYIQLTFDTPWSPPEAFYNNLTKQGYTVEATFCEQGSDFIGYYRDGVTTSEPFFDESFENVNSEKDNYYDTHDVRITKYFQENGFTHQPLYSGG